MAFQRNYFRILWRALLNYDLAPGWVVVKKSDHDAMRARLAQFEKRSAAGKKSHVTRKAKTVGFQIDGDTGAF